MRIRGNFVFTLDICEKVFVRNAAPRFYFPKLFFDGDKLFMRENVVLLGGACKVFAEKIPTGENDIFIRGKICARIGVRKTGRIDQAFFQQLDAGDHRRADRAA